MFLIGNSYAGMSRQAQKILRWLVIAKAISVSWCDLLQSRCMLHRVGNFERKVLSKIGFVFEDIA